MQRILALSLVAFGLSVFATCGMAREITLTHKSSATGGYGQSSDTVTVGTNETAQVTSIYGDGGNGPDTRLDVIKNGITNQMMAANITSTSKLPLVVAGPATIRLITANPRDETWFCTVKIETESFPPGQTIILPEGTVGVVRVESSTNLISWQTEWSHTFSNTNQNRFFRLAADRSLP